MTTITIIINRPKLLVQSGQLRTRGSHSNPVHPSSILARHLAVDPPPLPLARGQEGLRADRANVLASPSMTGSLAANGRPSGRQMAGELSGMRASPITWLRLNAYLATLTSSRPSHLASFTGAQLTFTCSAMDLPLIAAQSVFDQSSKRAHRNHQLASSFLTVFHARLASGLL